MSVSAYSSGAANVGSQPSFVEPSFVEQPSVDEIRQAVQKLALDEELVKLLQTFDMWFSDVELPETFRRLDILINYIYTTMKEDERGGFPKRFSTNIDAGVVKQMLQYEYDCYFATGGDLCRYLEFFRSDSGGSERYYCSENSPDLETQLKLYPKVQEISDDETLVEVLRCFRTCFPEIGALEGSRRLGLLIPHIYSSISEDERGGFPKSFSSNIDVKALEKMLRWAGNLNCDADACLYPNTEDLFYLYV